MFKGWKNYLWIIIGSVITAASINLFLLPYKIAPGGVSGIATIVFYLSSGKFPVGITMLALNIPLFLAGMKYIGRRFIVRTFFSTILLSVIVDGTQSISELIFKNHIARFENISSYPDILLFSIFGGVVMGAGLGIVFRAGATTGGTDLAARIVNHFKPNFTMGQLLLVIDTCIIVFAAISFKSFQLGLYAIVTLFVSSKIIDTILEGVNFSKAVFIISDHSDAISQKILSELERGVTALKGQGVYTGTDKKVLLCVLDRGQLPFLKDIVKSIDEKAFVILTDVREVFGEGFKTYD